jgi:hypothetical protein
MDGMKELILTNNTVSFGFSHLMRGWRFVTSFGIGKGLPCVWWGSYHSVYYGIDARLFACRHPFVVNQHAMRGIMLDELGTSGSRCSSKDRIHRPNL